jgi:cyclophilin family peptidyl-prolyl cis-trans isomerase
MSELKLFNGRGAVRALMSVILSAILLGLSANNSISCRLDGEHAQAADARKVLMIPQQKFWRQKASNLFRVRFKTTKGDFIIEVHRDLAPHGVDRFYNLVRAGFFDDSRFFRVRAGFIAQFGIPGNPSIAAVWKDQTIPDDPARQSNSRGTISYAMTGPNARTSQLFINLGDNSRLDKEGFAPIGKVIEGMNVVDQLYAGYGEEAGGGMRGGKQGKIFEGGNTYLDREFPKLDKLLRAIVETHRR